MKGAEEAKDGTGAVSTLPSGPSQHSQYDDADDIGMNDGMKDAVRDAFFGQDAPAPYEFVAGGAEKAEAEAARERAVQLRRKFLGRRVQGYGL